MTYQEPSTVIKYEGAQMALALPSEQTSIREGGLLHRRELKN
jgi:hypothetical protein